MTPAPPPNADDAPEERLRRRAEARLDPQSLDVTALSSAQVRDLVYELRVHQAELEIQNEELRTAQLELAATRDRYLDLYELAPVGYLTLDAHRIVRNANLTAAAILRIEGNRLIGQPLEKLVAIEERDACYLHLREAARTASRQLAELRLAADTDPPRWVLLETTHHPQDEPATGQWRVALRDITERKHIERALRESKERFRTMADGLPLIVWVHDATGRQEFVNRTFGEFFGIPVEDFTPEEWLDLLHPEDRELYLDEFRASMCERRPFTAEVRVKRADGQWRWLESWGRPRWSPAGEFLGMVGSSADVTKRKEAEAALQRLNTELEQRVADQTGILRLLSDVVAAANQASSFEEVLNYAVRRISEHNGWCFGHAYIVVDDDPPVLLPVRSHYESRPGRFRRFREATVGMRLVSGQGLPGRAYAAREVQWADDLRSELVARRADTGDDLGLACGAAFPVFVGDEVVGVLEFFSDHRIEPTERLLDSMASIGTQLGRVAERERFERSLARALIAEQQRLGRELHDTVGQDLAGLALMCERLARQARAGTAPGADELEELTASLRQGLDDTRAMVRGLVPPALEADTFVAALGELAAGVTQRSGVACEVEVAGPVPIAGPDEAVHLYRMASEAVTNALKHGHPQRIAIALSLRDDILLLEVRDDGVGMPDNAHNLGTGLQIMQHRAKVIGASIDIRRGPAGGTIVACSLPLDCQ